MKKFFKVTNVYDYSFDKVVGKHELTAAVAANEQPERMIKRSKRHLVFTEWFQSLSAAKQWMRMMDMEDSMMYAESY